MKKIAFLWTLLFGLIVDNVLATTDDPYWTNLGLNKTATQSSTATNGEAWRAVDGTSIPAPASCSKTNEESSPYLGIDLGEEMFPTYVRVALDYENSVFQYNGFIIKLGNNADYQSNGILRRFTITKGADTLNQVLRGRYLSIHVPETTTVLSICEVSVIKLPFDQIAYRKPVKDSVRPTTYAGHGRTYELTNHLISTFARTDVVPNPWLRIDLEDSYYIREVIVVALIYGDPITDFSIRTGHSLVDGGRANPSCGGLYSIQAGGVLSVFCRKKGRYVVITKDSELSIQLLLLEMLVNPSHQSNYAESIAPVFFAAPVLQGFTWSALLTNNVPENSGIITNVATSGIWLRLDLGKSIAIGKIMIAAYVPEEYKDQLTAFELRVGDSLDNDGNSNPLCLDGLQSMFGKIIESFFCKPGISGQYVNLKQDTTDKRLAMTEIAVYSDYEPRMKDRFKGRQIWRSIGENIVLSCSAYGKPTPALSWIKDGVTLKTDPDGNALPLEITDTSLTDSGIYECWANNTHGEDYMPFYVNITSDTRPCAESAEIELSSDKAGSSHPADESEILGNKWYRFYDGTSKNYLKILSRPPKKDAACNTWINGDHSGSKAAVVTRTACVKEGKNNCARQYEVRIRSCFAYYVYNLPWSRESNNVIYCFESDSDTHKKPTIAMKVKTDHALFNHVFHTETAFEESTQCMIMCGMVDRCRSYNFSDKEGVCELNSSTKQKHTKDFLPRNGYDYYMKGGAIVTRRRGDL